MRFRFGDVSVGGGRPGTAAAKVNGVRVPSIPLSASAVGAATQNMDPGVLATLVRAYSDKDAITGLLSGVGSGVKRADLDAAGDGLAQVLATRWGELGAGDRVSVLADVKAAKLNTPGRVALLQAAEQGFEGDAAELGRRAQDSLSRTRRLAEADDVPLSDEATSMLTRLEGDDVVDVAEVVAVIGPDDIGKMNPSQLSTFHRWLGKTDGAGSMAEAQAGLADANRQARRTVLQKMRSAGADLVAVLKGNWKFISAVAILGTVTTCLSMGCINLSDAEKDAAAKACKCSRCVRFRGPPLDGSGRVVEAGRVADGLSFCEALTGDELPSMSECALFCKSGYEACLADTSKTEQQCAGERATCHSTCATDMGGCMDLCDAEADLCNFDVAGVCVPGLTRALGETVGGAVAAAGEPVAKGMFDVLGDMLPGGSTTLILIAVAVVALFIVMR